MITELYNSIAAALGEVEGGIIRHVDLWNQNVEFIEEDEAWERPAVFVEFGEIVWRQYKGPEDGMWGDAEIFLHIVTDWKGSAASGADTREETLSDYELPDRIQAAMLGLRGTTFRNVSLSRTITNHNHQELLENIDVYKVTFARNL